jgi:hypothetical protein
MKKFVIDRSHVVVNSLVVEADNLNQAMEYARSYTMMSEGQHGGIVDRLSSRVEGIPSYKRRKDLEE